MSTRNRGEPPLKKRALSPPPPPAPTRAPPPKAAPSPLQPPAELTIEGLPLRLRDGQHLPTLSEPQDLNLHDNNYQSIAERSVGPIYVGYNSLTLRSGVLAASLEHSRRKWLIDGVFETYWSKPTKRKALGDAPNPAKETMTKLGVCSMIVEPHVFEVTLYTVKDIPASYPPAYSRPAPYPAPQYNPYPPYPYRGSYDSAHAPPPQPYAQSSHLSQTSLPPFRESFGQYGSQGPPPAHHSTLPPMRQEPPQLPRSESSGRESSRPEDPKADPVIQMLATRAASNQHLKSLMKIVASGVATQPQLDEFQEHINELNEIIKSRPPPSEPKQVQDPPKPPPPNDPEPSPNIHEQVPTKEIHWKQAASAIANAPTHSDPAPTKVEPPSQSYPISAPPNNSAYAPPKPEISAVVFDIAGGNGDRFKFPRFSILEYQYGGTQVVVSFLVSASSTSWP